MMGSADTSKRSSSGSSPTNQDYAVDVDISRTQTNASNMGLTYGGDEEIPRTWRQRVVDSFKPDPRFAREKGLLGAVSSGRAWDPHAAAENTANSPLARKLKGRHLQMIAIGGSIGTGLFVASGKALHNGGPASLLIAFLLIGTMLYCTVHALGEMAVLYPVAGSFSAYSTRFIDPAWGFAMGWNYALQWLVVLPLEIISASITIKFWNQDIPHVVFVGVFLVVIVGINLVGVKGYGEAEFIFSIIKVIAVVGFILLGIVINCGGGADGTYIGGRYWKDPGAFNNGFKGVCSVFVTAAFSFAGTELVGLTAAETQNPRKSIPKACKQVFWRITLFYILSLTVVGLLVPYTDPRLLSATSKVDLSASPFVIAIKDAGIDILPSIMNVVILVAVLSVGNSSIFGSSRTLAALSAQGQAPRFLGYVDRKGRPLFAIIAASILGFIAFVADSRKQGEVLEWLVSLSGLSGIITWGSINFAHIRFRKAWKQQGHSLDELAFQSQPGIIGSWIGLFINIGILAAQFWTGAWPAGYASMTGAQQARHFFLSYAAAPVILCFFFGWKFIMKSKIVRTAEIDLRSGRREMDLEPILKKEREEMLEWPRWKRGYSLVC